MLKIEYNNFDFNSSEYRESALLADNAAKGISGLIKSNEPYYKIFSIDSARQMAKECQVHAEHIKTTFSDIVVIGMGGAVLNPESVLSLCKDNKSDIRIHFLHNTDPIYLQNLLNKVSLKDCVILAISNSGNTLETNSLVGVMIAEYEKAGIKDLSKSFYFITNLKSGILREIAEKIDATIIEHETQISGRYSGLSSVTSFIAQIAGLDIEAFFDGAERVVNDFIQQGANSSPAKSASSIHSTGLGIMVNIGYLQSFGTYLEWYSQIIAESLGKNGSGITPIRGLGPNDQHSMMQLYLDGQKDKIYSLFYVENIDGLSEAFSTSDLLELGYIANKKLADINSANFDATKRALIKRGLLTRTLILGNLSAQSIGELVAHSMFEIITLGHMMNINSFDQPGVELIKNESRRLV
jgi:glucose-6-phosphate isomerase